MGERTNITVIIPVHEISEGTEKLFRNAIKSVEGQTVRPEEVLIVVPANSGVEEFLSKYDFGEISNIVRLVPNSGKTDFASQLNLGVEECKTEWFTLLEYDDELSKIWIKNVIEYRSVYPDIDMFLPIVVDVNEEGVFIGLTNEAVWANEFSDEMGILDKGALERYQNFNIDGMALKTEIYKEFGGMKPSMKLTFIYEFLLRLAHNSVEIMIIPRFGYRHVNQRKGSLFHTYKETMHPDEARWWLSLAKKEFFHVSDRNITYEK